MCHWEILNSVIKNMYINYLFKSIYMLILNAMKRRSEMCLYEWWLKWKIQRQLIFVEEIKREGNEYYTGQPLTEKRTNQTSETCITYISMDVPDMHFVTFYRYLCVDTCIYHQLIIVYLYLLLNCWSNKVKTLYTVKWISY